MAPSEPVVFSPVVKGDCIGVIATSASTHPDLLKSGVAALEQFGFRVKVMLEPSAAHGSPRYLFSSDTAERRAAALEDLYRDDEVRAILAVRGAYGGMEIVPLVDWSVATQYRKPFIGFSDATALLIQIARVGGVAIHGPGLQSGFAKIESDPNIRRSADALVGVLSGQIRNPFEGFRGAPLAPAAGDLPAADAVLRPTRGEGALVGGSLSLLTSLLGTPWDISFDDKVLFFEEVGERPHRVHQMLLQMKLAGKFRKVRGVVVGDLLRCEYPDKRDPGVMTVLRDIFRDLPIPVLTGMPFGHAELNLPLLLGARGRICDELFEVYP